MRRDQPVAQAQWILAHPSDHSRDDGIEVIRLLTSECAVDKLTVEELRLLIQAYEWCGRCDDAFMTAKICLCKRPHDTEILLLVDSCASQFSRGECIPYLSACDRLLAEEIGPSAFWWLRKADLYIELAKQVGIADGRRWSCDELLHPDLRRLAASSMSVALTLMPHYIDAAVSPPWVGDWNLRFAAVLQDPIYWYLARPIDE